MDFMARMAKRDTAAPLDPLNISGAMMNLAKAMGGNREQVAQAQALWWNNVMTLWEATARRMLGGETQPVVQPAPATAVSGPKRGRKTRFSISSSRAIC